MAKKQVKSYNTDRAGYVFEKQWSNFVYNNLGCDSISILPTHHSLIFALIRENNRHGWSVNFQAPTEHMMAISAIRSYDTYKKVFKDLESWGFVKTVSKGVNVHVAKTVTLLIFSIVDSTVVSTVTDRVDSTVVSTQLLTIRNEETFKPLNYKKEEERKAFVPPSEFDVSVFFKKISNWDEKKCEVEANSFLVWCKGLGWMLNGQPISPWESAAKGWVKNEPTFKSKSDGYARQWPNHYDPELDRTLSPKEHQQYGSHLISNCNHIVKKTDLGKFIAFVPKNPVEQNTNADIMNQLASKFANNLKK